MSFNVKATGMLGTQSHTYTTLGSYTVTVTVTNQNGLSGQQTFTVSVGAAAASHLAVSGFPSPITAGVSGNFMVTAQDPYGNTASAYTGTVHFTSSDSQLGAGDLPTDYTFVAADHGAKTFTAILLTTGTPT